MKKAIFIERDGVLISEIQGNSKIEGLEKLEFCPGVFQYLSRIVIELDYDLVMIIMQDETSELSWINDKVLKTFRNEGIEFAEIITNKAFSCNSEDAMDSENKFFYQYLNEKYESEKSIVIANTDAVSHLAEILKFNLITMTDRNKIEKKLLLLSWREIFQYLKSKPRTVKIKRKTSETEIDIALNLDGSGKSKITTGIGFFDHMLEQIAKHGELDIDILAKGDLHVDEHHIVEDVAITLGDAFSRVLANKKGIERYGFLLPMDDCLSQVAIDFSGRPYLMWDAKFQREKIGDMPTEMFFHFFKSFSDNARCNLNIKAEGENEHHKIESIFKAFAKSVKMAVERTDNFNVPSTKGSL